MKTLFNYDLTLNEAIMLINNNVDVNEQDIYKQTPLYYIKSFDIAKVLLENGANVHHFDTNGHTPLFKAANKDIAKLLIQYGANVNHIDIYGLNALYYINNSDVIDILIQNKANFNAPNNDYDAPLDYKIDTACALAFIKHGAIPGKIITYEMFRDLFTEEQQKAFDAFLTITPNDEDFFQMCAAYQECITNNNTLEIKDIYLL